MSAGLIGRQLGAGPGTPLLWIHGLGESGRGFDAIARHSRLAGRRQLLPDLPDAFADAVAGQLAAWGL